MFTNGSHILSILSSPSNSDPEISIFFFTVHQVIFLRIKKAHEVGNDALLSITTTHAQKP